VTTSLFKHFLTSWSAQGIRSSHNLNLKLLIHLVPVVLLRWASGFKIGLLISASKSSSTYSRRHLNLKRVTIYGV
jgi:hypothetical protein